MVPMLLLAHPHVIQNSESYKGKLIAYSVGNFRLTSNLGRDTSLGLGVEFNLEITGGNASDAYQKVAATARRLKISV